MERAVEWFRFAYEKGSTLALKRLGDMYQDGNGVKADPVTALDIYIKAAELRDKDAAMVLCVRFKSGNELCPADTRLSREWSYQGEHGEGLFETYNKEIGFGSGSYDSKYDK
jgi:TPR repeat protein